MTAPDQYDHNGQQHDDTAAPDIDPDAAVDIIQAETLAEEPATMQRPPAGGISPGWHPRPDDLSQQQWWDGDGWIGPKIASIVVMPAAPMPLGYMPDADEPGVEVEPLPDYAVISHVRGLEVAILPRRMWPMSVNRAAADGDFYIWANGKDEDHPGALLSDVDAFLDIDPTNDELNAMFGEFNQRERERLGKANRKR